MPEQDPTRIGYVKHVLGAQVTISLDDSMAGVTPIYQGRLYHIGQIGSIIRIPQGLIDLVAQVTLLSIAELAGVQARADIVQTGKRWIQAQLLGEIDRSTGYFQRGVGNYPGLEDPVHFATAEDLKAVYPHEGDKLLRIGCLAAAEEIPVCLDPERLVLRHGAIVGSTGVGKTTTVATILQRLAQGGWPAANIIVIDPHGEYADAFGTHASVRSVLDTGDNQLQVPYWALSVADIMKVFIGPQGGRTIPSRLNELIREARQQYASQSTWLTLDSGAITADTPIPFNIKEVWHKIDSENNETLDRANDPTSVCVESEGNPATLTPTQYKPYSQGSARPFKGPSHGDHGVIPDLLRLGLRDPRLAFFREPEYDPKGGDDPLIEVLTSWLGNGKPVSVLDFSGVPAHASELAIGVVIDLLFEVAVRSTLENEGIGRACPVLIVLEEAHRYLGDSAAPIAHDAANRVAREGRKYGIGLLLVTQRPSELPGTALAQCGSLIAMRLTNSADQSRISAALPDSVSGLAEVLPSLRTGEAIVTGESLELPSRTLIDMLDLRPSSDDPSLAPWRSSSTRINLVPALVAWRELYSGDQ